VAGGVAGGVVGGVVGGVTSGIVAGAIDNAANNNNSAATLSAGPHFWVSTLILCLSFLL
jgi:hypothetical protein